MPAEQTDLLFGRRQKIIQKFRVLSQLRPSSLSCASINTYCLKDGLSMPTAVAAMVRRQAQWVVQNHYELDPEFAGYLVQCHTLPTRHVAIAEYLAQGVPSLNEAPIVTQTTLKLCLPQLTATELLTNPRSAERICNWVGLSSEQLIDLWNNDSSGYAIVDHIAKVSGSMSNQILGARNLGFNDMEAIKRVVEMGAKRYKAFYESYDKWPNKGIGPWPKPKVD